MNTITIPKGFAKGGFVIVPQAEYESLKSRAIPVYMPTPAERRMIARARARMHKNRAAGKLIPLRVLERDLARRG